MASRRSKDICRYHRSAFPLSSNLLFLSWILPTSSFAQLASSLPSTSNPTLTTLSTSTLPPSPSSTDSPPTQTQQDLPPAAATSTNASTTINAAGARTFNYYFLLVAVFAILFFLCIFWFGRRKKRKAAIMRSQSQRALARDVEGWRTRFRAGLGGGNNGVRVEERVEGLDERGEAPPPYVPGSKPPSVRSLERRRSSVEGGLGEVELRRLSAETRSNPPGYHEASRGTDESSGHEDVRGTDQMEQVTRPMTAVTASERFGGMRTLLDRTGSSLQA